VPTSPGSGSEARAEVTLLRGSGSFTVASRRLLPELSLLDAELTAGLQPLLTAAAGFNALARACEAFLAQGDHPLADPLALESVRRTVTALRGALQSGRDLAAREGLLLGGYLAGVASAKGQGACRAAAQALGAVGRLPHGLACAALLPGVLGFDRMAGEERLAQLARLLGADARAPAPEAAQAAVHLVEELRVLAGLPRKLGQAGVRREQLPLLVEAAFADRAHARSPRPCSEVDFERLFNEAL
jgi:alcohol dehydrogenase class IV